MNPFWKTCYSRSCHWRWFVKKDVLRNFAKFTGKHLCQRLFLNKVTGLHRCFPVNFEKFLRTPFLQKTSERLLLWFAFTKVTKKEFFIAFLFFCFNKMLHATFFVTIVFAVKTIECHRFHNRKIFYFTLDWLKREIKIFSSLINHEKILFHNISGAIHGNNISEILILFEYFRKMYPCHRRSTYAVQLFVSIQIGCIKKYAKHDPEAATGCVL